MTSATLDEQLRDMVENRAVLPLTVDRCHKMIADGVVPEGEPFELLNGYVIHKDRSAAGNEPESDAAIVIGTEDNYRGRHPGARDVSCVIEAADSSLHRDRTTKLRIHAVSRIPRYFIINLPDRMVEMYARPNGNGRAARYGQVEMLNAGQAVELPAPRGNRLRIPLRRLVP